MSSTTSDPVEPSGKVARLVDRLSKDITGLQIAPKKPPKPLRIAHVRFSYVAQQEDELNMEEEDVIEVIEDVEDGWARGKLNDKVGLFPTNFVAFAPNPPNTTSTYSTSSLSRVSEERKSETRKSKDASPSNGKTMNTSPTAEKPINNNTSTSASPNVLPSSFKASLRRNGAESKDLPVNSNNSVPPVVTSATSAKTKEYAKVLYEYKSAHPDELDLKEGAIIIVLNKKCADEGWCEGEHNGKRGLFPENFVRMMSQAPQVAERPISTAVSAASASNNNAAPPLLPAKPIKSVFNGKTSDPPVPAPTTNGVNNSNGSTQPTTNTHVTLEERKSMIAGLQSKLFPQGKFPPHKPTFTPPAGSLTTSSYGNMQSAEPDTIPVIQSRHSIMDPTKLGISLNHGTNHDETAPDEPAPAPPVPPLIEEPKQLESLTKFRPKQPGKRPPSSQFRQSNLSKTPEEDSILTGGTPSLLSTASTISGNSKEVASTTASDAVVAAVPTGPATTSFPATPPERPAPSPPLQNSPSPQTSPALRNPTIDTQNVIKELASVASALGPKATGLNPTTSSTSMGSKPSRPSPTNNNSSNNSPNNPSNSHFYTGSTKNNSEQSAPSDPPSVQLASETISRSEFEDLVKRVAKLEEHVQQLVQSDVHLHHL